LFAVGWGRSLAEPFHLHGGETLRGPALRNPREAGRWRGHLPDAGLAPCRS